MVNSFKPKLYTLQKISKSLLKTDEVNLKNYFVAAAVEINAFGQARHAGIVFHCEEGYFLFHFKGNIDLEENPVGWYFHKSINFILPEFCDQFLGHCRKIQKYAKPKLGMFYPGSYYKDGKYFTENNEAEYMSFVGFCINVIKGFLEADEYFEYKDWNGIDFKRHYLEDILKDYKAFKPDITEDDIAAHIRRITPPEFISFAFLEKLPIRRAEVRKIHNVVSEAIRLKRAN